MLGRIKDQTFREALALSLNLMVVKMLIIQLQFWLTFSPKETVLLGLSTLVKQAQTFEGSTSANR